ncbi:arginase family protein [Sneathiella glossodoripedis]|uniref:arginase family protein n=1 Tax=Sneathiella glossodoripedis TaxID=418853 RepID=UPI000ABE27DC|nr:arginase family protein [Sneathiella glossodoripedis]
MTDSSMFSNPQTFMNVPYDPQPEGAHAAILGVPFDAGTSPDRIGSRGGPNAIRAQSRQLDQFQPPFTKFSPVQRLNLVDCGDVNVIPSVIEQSFDQTEKTALSLHEAGAAPLGFGGDGMISLPLLRAANAHHKDMVVLHIDAHTDTYRSVGQQLHEIYNTATTFTRAAEEKLIDTQNSWHVGIRGTASQVDVFEHTQSHGYNIISAETFFEQGYLAIAQELKSRLKGRAVYLCFDMDFFDPSTAPGVCSPTWGGATAREGLGFLRALQGLDIIAADINTVSPPHDVGGMTALLAANVAFEILTLFCHSPTLKTKFASSS